MCGIAGIIYPKSEENRIEFSKNARAGIASRGPDGFGYWENEARTVSLIHSRLSILDLSDNGSQPMVSHCGNFVITYNGEIYNHIELREKLRRELHGQWNSNSDSETLVNLISIVGFEETLSLVDGMFSIACLDIKRNFLYLARDRFGEKPLYYSFDEQQLCFGSILSIFTRCNFVPKSIDMEALTLYFQKGYIPAPMSIFHNVKKLKPGFFIMCNLNNNSTVEKQYYSIESHFKCVRREERKYDTTRILSGALDTAVASRSLSDVPVGVFLSGGIDSSLIASSFYRNFGYVKTFSLGVENYEHSELHQAGRVAGALNAEHHEIIISEEDVLDVVSELPKYFDEPFSDSSQIPTFLLSCFAKQHVKVALGGDGGDELFYGYNRYFRAAKLHRIANGHVPKPALRVIRYIAELQLKAIGRFFKFSIRGVRSDKLMTRVVKLKECIEASSIEEMARVLSTICTNYENVLREPHANSRLKVDDFASQDALRLRDLCDYFPNDILTKVDRSSMATGLEVRTPFLTKEVIDIAFKLKANQLFDNNKGKVVLREILNERFGLDFFSSVKSGFTIPTSKWLRNELREWGETLIYSQEFANTNYLNMNEIRTMWNHHQRQYKDLGNELWTVLMLLNWAAKNRQYGVSL